MNITEWIEQVINGSGGLISFDDHEGADFNVPRGDGEAAGVAAWVIRCLANPQCAGSAEVLQAIAERRAVKAEVTP